MSSRVTPSRSPEPGVRHDDKGRHHGTSNSPSPIPPSASPTPLDSVWLGIYDRVSRSCFRVQIQDPLFLQILNNSVVPAAESDGALPFEMTEFVEYVDTYERERLHLLQQQQQATASGKRHNGTAASSGSLGYVSGGIYSASGAVAGKQLYSDASAHTTSSTAVTSASFGIASAPTNTSNSAAVPLKLEETLRQTLSENSDFFFRVASVAYQLEPHAYTAAASFKATQVVPSSTGGDGIGIRGSDPTGAATSGSLSGARRDSVIMNATATSSAAGTVGSLGGGLVSAAANGMTSMLTGALPASSPAAVPHRNYAVEGGYSAAFQLCGRLFALVYHDHCHALAEKIAARFSALRLEDCVKFHKAVWAGFHLKARDPIRSATRSESNLEVRWVSEKIKDDKHLFPDAGVIPQQQQQNAQQQQQAHTTSSLSRIVDATLSYVANGRRRVHSGRGVGPSTNSTNATTAKGNGSGGETTAALNGDTQGEGSGAPENEMQTFGLTKLLHNPSWQKDEESSDACPSCGRAFLSVSRPLGARAHHCRSCGIRLCVFCITKRAHYSFAKLTKPGSVDESEERFVCDVCYSDYEATRQLHYLGALFAFAGLGFSDLVLCRTVNEQWREAAELCISEYRVLLHNCDADMHSVMTPVGVLLKNSLFLLLGEGPTSSISVVHHPEAALLLLKFIATENLWMQDGSYYFITRLSNSILNRADMVLTNLPSSATSANVTLENKRKAFQLPVIPTLSHWHLFCTAFCSRISSSFFFVKCAELLCSAPPRVYDAYVAKSLERMTSLYLNTTPLWQRLAKANRATEAAFCEQQQQQQQSMHGSLSLPSPLPLPTLADVTEGQLVTIWLLDMLHKDAMVPVSRRRYQQLLERVIPVVATSSLSLVFVLMLSLRSNYSFYGYDEELFVLWRSRILAEVARVDPEAKDRVVATLDFYTELDRFCAQSSAVNQVSVVEWIVRYCTRGQAGVTHKPSTAAATTGSASSVSPSPSLRGAPSSNARPRSQRYVDLPHPMVNPFKPYMVVRSIRLSGVRVAPNAATKPIWLAFSTWTSAEHSAYDDACRAREVAAAAAAAAAAQQTGNATATAAPLKDQGDAPLSAGASFPSLAPASPPRCAGDSRDDEAPPLSSTSGSSAGPLAQECLFLYKRENVERDQLMCISSRLLQMLLASEIGNAEMLDYSVLPLSCDSGLIEKAAGRELSNLENMDITSYVLHRGQQGCTNFLASAKLFLLLNYIFSIGDRHKGNVLIGSNGALLHIDFRFIFSEKTFVEKLARSTVRIDDAFLAAVEECQLRQTTAASQQDRSSASCGGCGRCPAGTPSPSSTATPSAFARDPSSPPLFSGNPNRSEGKGPASSTSEPPPTPAELRAAFFASAAEWFVHVRPFAAVFYELWLYAVHRHTVPYNEKELLTMLNTLFDRHASQVSSASKFSTTMKQSVNVCRLKDVTHSSAEVLRSFTDQVSRRVSESGAGAVKMVGNMWSNWWSRGS